MYLIFKGFSNQLIGIIMAAWEGFTDAELQKIQSSGNHSNKLKSKAQPKIAKPVSKKKNAITSSVPCSTILNIVSKHCKFLQF